jgi:predicted porin
MHLSTIGSTGSRVTRSCAVAVLLLGSGAVAAEGWFVGAGLGKTDLKDYYCYDCPDITSIDDTDTGFYFNGGYRFSENFALAGEYVDLGTTKAGGPDVDDKLEATGFGLVAVGILPLSSRFELFGKLGLFRWSQDVNYESEGWSGSGDFSGTDPSFGLGVTYYFDEQKNLAVQGEWRRFKDIGESIEENPDLGHQNDIDMFSIGISYHF